MLRVRTDDEIYRVDAVWLGPPRATFPWRATYASYLTGFLIFVAVLFAQRRMGIAFSIFPTAWALVVTVFLTKVINRKVNYEKGVVQLFEHLWHEVCGPRKRTVHRRSALRSDRVRVRQTAWGSGGRAPARPRPIRREAAEDHAARAAAARSRPTRPVRAMAQARRPRPHPLRPGGDR